MTDIKTADLTDPNKFQLARKRKYTVLCSYPAYGTHVFNKLEKADYVTSEKTPFVLTGTAGEQWIVDRNKLFRTYTMPDGQPIPENFFDGKQNAGSFELMTASVDLNFAQLIPASQKAEITTAWGTALQANADGIPHRDGDYAVCTIKDGRPDLTDMWVVNGEVFPNTYEFIDD